MDETLSKAEELARIGRENDLAELEYEDKSVKLHLTFEAPNANPPSFDPSLLAGLASPTRVEAAPQTESPTAPPPAKSGKTVDSPLAGVFYQAPRPDAPAFVEVGASVQKGHILCIVEAMKLMNELAAEQACTIVEVLVENGQAVEEGQPLFVIS